MSPIVSTPILLVVTASVAFADVVEIPVSFEVMNVNTSKFVSCPGDGKGYTLAGHFVLPDTARLEPPDSIMVYVGTAAVGQAIWRFPLEGYNLAAKQAMDGHSSLVLDRIGYGDGAVPGGFDVCVGSDADTVHQVVGQLRSGTYPANPWPGHGFGRIAIGGVSVSAAIAEVEAYSFHDVDALIIHEWLDGDSTTALLPTNDENAGLLVAAADLGATCAHGGDRKRDERAEDPTGYAYLGRVDIGGLGNAGQWCFFDPEPQVLSTIAALHERDPCGTEATVIPGFFVDTLFVGDIDIPVLLVYGEQGLIRRPAAHRQAARYTGSSDVTLEFVPNAGHCTMLEKLPAREQYRKIVADWLTQRGF